MTTKSLHHAKINSTPSSSCVLTMPLSVKLEVQDSDDSCGGRQLQANAIEIGLPNTMQKMNHTDTVSDWQLKTNTKLIIITEARRWQHL